MRLLQCYYITTPWVHIYIQLPCFFGSLNNRFKTNRTICYLLWILVKFAFWLFMLFQRISLIVNATHPIDIEISLWIIYQNCFINSENISLSFTVYSPFSLISFIFLIITSKSAVTSPAAPPPPSSSLHVSVMSRFFCEWPS